MNDTREFKPRRSYRRRGLDYARNPNGEIDTWFLVINPKTNQVLAYYDKEGNHTHSIDKVVPQSRVLKCLPDNIMKFLL